MTWDGMERMVVRDRRGNFLGTALVDRTEVERRGYFVYAQATGGPKRYDIGEQAVPPGTTEVAIVVDDLAAARELPDFQPQP